ncbi:hypothetical protein LGT39_12900 [Demequina sp. TTPB684]|uniref:hypothetical protein n=1 Tax=unclassified Demequina TaxID=2620311 RepID=UPI001CF21AB0|nr:MULTISPECIES: hypothetical protein [unclassified Demequina]MCB2413742.1 hypothetical protein [Demequina sp. TTPB684]UPU89587.1 hypothetical protein LGT36_006570 [Demequina sp. TMPB413]
MTDVTTPDAHSGDADAARADSADFVRGQLAERERFAEYLAHFEKSSRAMAEAATTDSSRVYQTTIANAMQAMGQAIKGAFHWQDGWRSS